MSSIVNGRLTKESAASFKDDGSAMAKLNQLLALIDQREAEQRTPEQIEAESAAATRDMRRAEAYARATKLNQRVPPPKGEEDKWWTVVLAQTAPPGCVDYSSAHYGIELEGDDGTWLVASIVGGPSWLPASHFRGTFPPVCKTINKLIEDGAIVVYPPGVKPPVAILESQAKACREASASFEKQDKPSLHKTFKEQAERLEEMMAG